MRIVLGPHGLDADRRLEIMRDSRNGTFGMLALALSVLIKVACLASFSGATGLVVLIAAHALSRATIAYPLLAYLLVDVLEKLEQFAEYGATFSEVVRFYEARLPLLASRVIPMGLLLGAALLVSGVASEGELIGMEACGIRAGRALVPVAAGAVGVPADARDVRDEALVVHVGARASAFGPAQVAAREDLRRQFLLAGEQCQRRDGDDCGGVHPGSCSHDGFLGRQR